MGQGSEVENMAPLGSTVIRRIIDPLWRLMLLLEEDYSCLHLCGVVILMTRQVKCTYECIYVNYSQNSLKINLFVHLFVLFE